MSESKTTFAQWHPPFVNTMRITLQKDEKNMEIQSEYSIQALPSRMDMCITLHNPHIMMHKSIGKIFRKYNLVEYKPQGKSMTFRDYCYMLGNAYLLGARGGAKAASLEEVSITLVSYNFPRKLFDRLKNRHRSIWKTERGLYYIEGEDFAVQVIVLNKLDPEEYVWLTSFHRGLSEKEQDRLLEEYRLHRLDKRYREVMDFLVGINKDGFERRKGMSEVLFELFRPQLEERMRQEMQKEMRQEMQEEMRQEMQREMRQEMQQEIFGLLAEQGEISADVRKKISEETVMEKLRDWLRKAAKADSVEEFASQVR